MSKLLSIHNVILFSSLIFVTSIAVAAKYSQPSNKVMGYPEPKKLIVVGDNVNRNSENVLITNDSYRDGSGFSKDYTMLDKQMVMQSSIVKSRDNALGKVYIPKSFEEASRLAELKHGIKRNMSKSAPTKISNSQTGKSITPVRKSEGISFLASVVYHSNGKSDLTDADLQSLREVAKFVKAKSARVLVVGHASSRTADMSMLSHKLVNYDVSVRRVNRIRDELLKNGLSINDISLSAVSDTETINNEIMPMSENVNRRSEIYISY